ncbi:catalase family peroxidase [Bremerella alba]|uniref:Catalase-related peroxidase n=1 Tax=Bremerella alba TaxID=980252 RepID=A0A7V8V7G0_9BACT|nr:catalase family peroxidase [Bremerella alba]MBA2116079.1 Catalase-related peroxidase [Bremerella alba]
METINEQLTETGHPHGSNEGRLMRMCAVILAVVVGGTTFAYAGGWLTPSALTPSRFVDTLEQVSGNHPGYRRNHARGVGVSGYFESNGNGEKLSRASIFKPGRVELLGRFSLSGGNPQAADSVGEVRGLGLQFTSTNGETWRTAMISLPVFPVDTPEAFHELLIASRPDPQTGKPVPSAMKEFSAKHPESAAANPIIGKTPISDGFANTTFHGLNTFYFTNREGHAVPVRWIVTPEQPFRAADTSETHVDLSFLFHDLAGAVHQSPLRWHLIVILGHPDDPVDDASIAWDSTRERVDLGVIVINAVEQEQDSSADKINFDPLVLPDGISPSNDPLLSARSAIYSQSFTRRAGETRSLPSQSELPLNKESGDE